MVQIERDGLRMKLGTWLRPVFWALIAAFSAWLISSAMLMAVLGFNELVLIRTDSDSASDLREAVHWAYVGVFLMLPAVAMAYLFVALASWLPALLARNAKRPVQRMACIILVTLGCAAWTGLSIALSNSPLYENDAPPSFGEIASSGALGAICGFVFAVATDWMIGRIELALPAGWRF